MDGMQWTPSMAEIPFPRKNPELIAQNLERWCPYPDWPCFMQTLLGPSESHDSEDNFLGVRQPATSEESDRYKFHTVKSFKREFPLKKRYAYSLPLSLPDTSEKMEAYRYRGNCLDILNMNKKTMVIYPGSECIKISLLQQKSVLRGRHRKLYDHVVCRITKPVYQIVSKLVAGNGYIVNRFKKTVDFICIQGDSEKIDSVTVNPKHKFVSTGVCLSSVLPGYFSMSYEDGTIYMFDVNSSKSLWKSNMQESKDSPSRTSYHSNFGNHPLTLYVNDNESVWFCDTRDKASRLLQSSQVLGDDICLLSHCEKMPYYYLATKSCLNVFDERYNKMPVMKWQHMLLNSPSLISKLKLDSNEIVMLSSTEDNQTCAILNEWVEHSYSTWCMSRSFPKHFNFMDTIDYAHTQGISFNSHTMERISSPTYGLKLCVFKFQTSLLTLNKFGDVFVQRFTTSGKSDEKESTGKKILIQWQEKVMDVMKAPDMDKYSKSYYTESDMTLEDLPGFTLPEKPSTQKVIWDLRPNKKAELNTFWQNTIIDDYITDKESNTAERIGRFFPKEITEQHTIDKNKKYSHPLTAKLLSLWKEEPPVDRGARYHSAPLLLNRLKRIPETMKGMDSQPEVEGDLYAAPPSQSEEIIKEKSQPKYLPNTSQIFQPSQSSTQGSKIPKKKNKRRRVDGF